MKNEVYHLEWFISGHVQGVGFRYSTLQTAREFAVTGEVKNLADGRVYLVAEGAEEEVSRFTQELKRRMIDFIRSIEEKSSHSFSQYDTFLISH